MNYVKHLNLLGVEAKEIPCITGEGMPSETIKGAIGCLYININNGILYKCIAANDNDNIYIWTRITNNDNVEYYETLAQAIEDIMNNQIGTNATKIVENAVASVGIDNNENLIITLLKDTIESTTITIEERETTFENKNVILNLNGKCIAFETGAYLRIVGNTNFITILGETQGSKIIKNLDTSTNTEMLIGFISGKLKLIGGEYEITIGETGTGTNIYGIRTNDNCILTLVKCKMNVNVPTGVTNDICCIRQNGEFEIIDSELILNTNSNQPNAALRCSYVSRGIAKNSKFFSYGSNSKFIMGIMNHGIIELIDCQAYGPGAGLFYQVDASYCKCYVNGGIYEGASAIRFHNASSVTGSISNPMRMYIENATLISSSYRGKNKKQIAINPIYKPLQAIDLNVTQYGELYLDNCVINGGRESIIKINNSNNTVYMSNCIIDKNTVNFTSNINNIIGLSTNEEIIGNNEKMLPRPVISIANKTNQLILGMENNFNNQSLLVNSTDSTSSSLDDFISNTTIAFYVREVIEDTTN